MEIERGTRIRYTDDGLGVIYPGIRRFAKPQVNKGDEGSYLAPYEISEPGWHLTEVVIEGETYWCPLHESMFEVIK